ncbi:hypothetical protein F8388_011094 [Cannabis sativa]|uniref:Uncharacterized protein n=1 Tax=Cannabis sativa TaxID=3483 RepID=A0A7J6H0X5_CANSA|nr:hypothetical protein F8388_011094 [Cannabis sativa]KAF4388608.1 hypothetical protein G4B88_021519 [Cannabis sativa]
MSHPLCCIFYTEKNYLRNTLRDILYGCNILLSILCIPCGFRRFQEIRMARFGYSLSLAFRNNLFRLFFLVFYKAFDGGEI